MLQSELAKRNLVASRGLLASLFFISTPVADLAKRSQASISDHKASSLPFHATPLSSGSGLVLNRLISFSFLFVTPCNRTPCS